MPSCGRQERWVGSLDLTHSRPALPAAPPNGKLYYVVQVRYRVSSPKYLWLQASEPVLRVWEKKKNRPCSLMSAVVGKYARQFWRALPGRNDKDKQTNPLQSMPRMMAMSKPNPTSTSLWTAELWEGDKPTEPKLQDLHDTRQKQVIQEKSQ